MVISFGMRLVISAAVITYCHIGQQATATLFAARTLGYSVMLYDGSFEDWSRRDLPVDNPSAPKK